MTVPPVSRVRTGRARPSSHTRAVTQPVNAAFYRLYPSERHVHLFARTVPPGRGAAQGSLTHHKCHLTPPGDATPKTRNQAASR